MFEFLFTKQKTPAEIKKKYRIPNKINLSFEITADGWFLVTSPELPGLITQARNAKELIIMVNDAILTYFDVPKCEANEIFNMISMDGHGIILSRKAVNEKMFVRN